VTFELPFAGVATRDETLIDGAASVGKAAPRPARILARKDGAWLESSLEQRQGTYPLTLHFHGRDIDSGLDVTVGPRGAVGFTRRPQ
jgi:hypothetical protein